MRTTSRYNLEILKHYTIIGFLPSELEAAQLETGVKTFLDDPIVPIGESAMVVLSGHQREDGQIEAWFRGYLPQERNGCIHYGGDESLVVFSRRAFYHGADNPTQFDDRKNKQLTCLLDAMIGAAVKIDNNSQAVRRYYKGKLINRAHPSNGQVVLTLQVRERGYTQQCISEEEFATNVHREFLIARGDKHLGRMLFPQPVSMFHGITPQQLATAETMPAYLAQSLNFSDTATMLSTLGGVKSETYRRLAVEKAATFLENFSVPGVDIEIVPYALGRGLIDGITAQDFRQILGQHVFNPFRLFGRIYNPIKHVPPAQREYIRHVRDLSDKKVQAILADYAKLIVNPPEPNGDIGYSREGEVYVALASPEELLKAFCQTNGRRRISLDTASILGTDSVPRMVEAIRDYLPPFVGAHATDADILAAATDVDQPLNISGMPRFSWLPNQSATIRDFKFVVGDHYSVNIGGESVGQTAKWRPQVFRRPYGRHRSASVTVTEVSNAADGVSNLEPPVADDSSQRADSTHSTE